MSRKTPQEKKALSYAKDCRNHYGEHDKGSRNSIRKHKKTQNQIYRRKVNQVLSEIENTEIECAEIVGSEAKSISKGNWKKCSGTPLGLFVELQKDIRERRVGRKVRGILKDGKLSKKFMDKLRERK